MDPMHDAAQWVRTWQQAGEALAKVKRRELREYDYAQHQQAIDEMLQWAWEHRVERSTSGLVEQQRWFVKMRDHMMLTETDGG